MSKSIRAILLVVLVVGIALTVLFPPTSYVKITPLSDEEKAAMQAQMDSAPAMPGGPGPGGPATVPDSRAETVLAPAMPIWQDAPGKQVNWVGWTAPEDQMINGTSPLSFLNGALFRIMIIAAVCLVPLAIADRAAKRPEIPADEVPAEGEAPEGEAPAE